GVIGVAHAGWRGAATGVLEATIAAMERCGADRARVAVALGPTIRQPNYEVGPEFVARFKAEDGANERFFRPSATPQHALFDLPRPPRRRRRAPARGPRPLHLCRCNAVLQLSPLHPPQRARLRAPHQRHRARRLAAISRISVPPCPFRARLGAGIPRPAALARFRPNLRPSPIPPQPL